jgi:hypothetical protein
MNTPVCHLMVGISTKQNTTNLVPFFQFGAEKILLLETNVAKEKKWSQGIEKVAERRGKSFAILPIGDGSDIASIMDDLKKKIDGIAEPICWNIGGGQKIQTLALITIFQERIRAGRADWLCYSDPQARSSITVTHDHGQLQSKELRTTVPDLILEEIVQVFNYTLDKNKQFCLWQRTEKDKGEIFEQHLFKDSQMFFFYNYDNRQRMLKYTLDNDHKEDNKDDPRPVFQDGPPTFGKYFEKVLQTLVARIVADNPAKHCINQVWSVEVQSTEIGDDKQEFDVLLVTDFGTLIALDAKTDEFAKKDEDARTLNLNKVSGLYTDFWSVFPFFKEDIERKDSLLQTNDEWKKVLNRPFEIKERDGKMLVVTERESKNLALHRKSKISVVQPDEPGALSLDLLANMLERLKLTTTR